jgi:antitoxin (DNA-binding transcriptional repressor) of toxin-antitoxin stability system
MIEKAISVTEAARNFADCINRVHYQGASFVLEKNGVAVARIVPDDRKSITGEDLATTIRTALKDVHLGEDEATAWLHDLEEAHRAMQPAVHKWQS